MTNNDGLLKISGMSGQCWKRFYRLKNMHMNTLLFVLVYFICVCFLQTSNLVTLCLLTLQKKNKEANKLNSKKK